MGSMGGEWVSVGVGVGVVCHSVCVSAWVFDSVCKYVCAVCTHPFNCTQMVVWFYIQNCVTCTPTGFSVCSCMLASIQTLLHFLIRFTIGNTETLAIPDIRDQVTAYYNKRYSSNLVSSCMPCSMLLYWLLQYSYTVLTYLCSYLWTGWHMVELRATQWVHPVRTFKLYLCSWDSDHCKLCIRIAHKTCLVCKWVIYAEKT